MVWRLEVVHHTTYVYESEVHASFNELRMTPVTDEHQILIQHRTSVGPTAPIFTYRDYWGTTVQSFDLQTAHMSLTVIAESLVDSYPTGVPQDSATWGELASSQVLDDYCEYLPLTKLTDAVSHSYDLRAYATPRDAVEGLAVLIRQQIEYWPGATHVFTPASQAWESGRGVCQDYTNIMLSILRSAGIPSRYVSGYLYSGNGELGETIVGESHSWVEAWVGYWHSIDPTNGRDVGEQHIAVARGRDYHDVSPMSGVFTGGRGREIHVSVSLTRLPR